MALSNTTNRVETAALSGVVGGNIVATFNSRISTDADLKVYEVTTSATTLLTLNSDYTLTKSLSGSLITGANVVATASAVAAGKFADGSVIVVIRETDYQQSSNYEPNAIIPADTLENDLDKLAMQTQQLKDNAKRAIQFSSTLPDNETPEPIITLTAAQRANKLLGFSADGSEFAVTQEIGNYRSDWATGTVYSVRDIVKQSSGLDASTLNNIYICNTFHTASGSYLTQFDTAKWDLIVDAAAAATSASAASASASAAAGSATTAEGHKDDAELAQAAAETAQGLAETAQGLAESAQAAAEGALTTIQGFYLGAQGSNPSVDGNGDPVAAGDWYFNTGDNTTRIYNGTSWDVIEALPQSLGTTDSPTFAGITAGTADIDGGTIDGTDITVGAGKTLHVSDGALTLADNQISGDKIDGGTISNFASTGIDDNASSTALTIDASGNVGINCSPSTKFEVNGSADAVLRLTDVATIGTVGRKVGAIEFYQNDASGGAGIGSSIESYHVNISGDTDLRFATGDNTERLRIDSSGNVGIGEISPDGKLHVSGPTNSTNNTDERSAIFRDPTTNQGSLEIRHGYSTTVPNNRYTSLQAWSNEYTNPVPLKLNSNGGDVIVGSGNVGIGTATAGKRLVVSRLGDDPSNIPTLNANITAVFHSGSGASGSGSGISLLGGNTSDGIITFDDVDASAKGRIIYRHSSDSLALETAGTERMRIDSSGNLKFDSGYGSVATAYGCRAWVNFDGTTNTGGFCDIRASGNVSSVTDRGTGQYTMNLTTAMPDANYATLFTAKKDGTSDDGYILGGVGTNGQTSSAVDVTVQVGSSGPDDSSQISVAVFR